MDEIGQRQQQQQQQQQMEGNEQSLPGRDGTMEYLSLREQEEVEEGTRKKGRAEKSATDMVREEEAR